MARTKPKDKTAAPTIFKCRDCSATYDRNSKLQHHVERECVARLERLVAEGKLTRG